MELNNQTSAALTQLSYVLEKQLDIILSNQKLVLAMHDTLKRLVPRYETEVLASLEAEQKTKTPQQDQNQAWVGLAKKTMMDLRNL